MKFFVITLFLIFYSNILFSQLSEVENCGLNDSPELTIIEANYFNEVFEEKRGEFDFKNKKIAFYEGSSGTVRSNKFDYFRKLKNSNRDKDVHYWQAGGTQLLILSEEEKERSGGYDVILVSWSKLYKQGKGRSKLVKRLNKTTSKKI